MGEHRELSRREEMTPMTDRIVHLERNLHFGGFEDLSDVNCRQCLQAAVELGKGAWNRLDELGMHDLCESPDHRPWLRDALYFDLPSDKVLGWVMRKSGGKANPANVLADYEDMLRAKRIDSK
jgi:hypothetical protein